MKIGIIGLGLIGGSIFKDLKRLNYDVVAVSASQNGENIYKDYEILKTCDLVFVCSAMNKTLEILDKLGSMPLPPYIKVKLDDKDRYQTVYAKNIGSAAAPTAGLHFTKELLKEIENKGITICYITLHVGLGTFRPVAVSDVTKHKMHSEFYSMTKEVADTLNKAKLEGRNIIAVGTTTTRTLETIMNKYNTFKGCSGWTDIFIYPGYEFKGIDGLITNFHLPKSTLVMLVSAFASKEIILNAYKHAVEEKYRFFSFGDAMFIHK